MGTGDGGVVGGPGSSGATAHMLSGGSDPVVEGPSSSTKASWSDGVESSAGGTVPFSAMPTGNVREKSCKGRRHLTRKSTEVPSFTQDSLPAILPTPNLEISATNVSVSRILREIVVLWSSERSLQNSRSRDFRPTDISPNQLPFRGLLPKGLIFRDVPSNLPFRDFRPKCLSEIPAPKAQKSKPKTSGLCP